MLPFGALSAITLILTSGPATSHSLQIYQTPQMNLNLHRLHMDQLRLQRDQRQALAERQEIETQKTLVEIQALRLPTKLADDGVAIPLSLEQERARREAQTRRREAIEAGAGQIDSWLDRGQGPEPR